MYCWLLGEEQSQLNMLSSMNYIINTIISS